MKKLITFVSILSFLAISGIASAGPNFCSKATVVKTGVANTGKTVYLRNDSGVAVGTSDEWAPGTTKAFFIHSSLEDAGLAVALTAMSLGKTVLAGSPDSTYPNWGYISYIYLNN